MVFNIYSPAVSSLWRKNSSLRHLNVSRNSQSIERFTGLCWGAGPSSLLTLEATISYYPAINVPACLIPYLLANKVLERVNLHGICFCTLALQGGITPEPELYPGCPIGQAISAHPSLRSILFDQALFCPHHPGAPPSTGVSIWTRILYHILTKWSISRSNTNTSTFSRNGRPRPCRVVLDNGPMYSKP